MAKKKKQKLVTKEINFLLLTLAFILAMGIIATKKYNPTKQIAEVIQEKGEGQQEYPIDTENDGIYRNYKYNFTLEYPEELFVESQVDDTHVAHFYTTKGFGTPQRGEIEKYPNDLFLSFIALGKDEFGYHEIQQSYDASVEYRDTIGKYNSNFEPLFKNIKVINMNDKKIAVNYIGANLYTTANLEKFPNLDIAYRNVYGYSANVILENYGLSITMISSNLQLLEKNENVFYQILDSLQTQ